MLWKQSGREMNKYFDSFLRSYGLLHCKSDTCIYYCRDKSLCIGTYVDDMLIVGEPNTINVFKLKAMEKFEAKDLGDACEIFSMKIQRHSDSSLSLNQISYTKKT